MFKPFLKPISQTEPKPITSNGITHPLHYPSFPCISTPILPSLSLSLSHFLPVHFLKKLILCVAVGVAGVVIVYILLCSPDSGTPQPTFETSLDSNTPELDPTTMVVKNPIVVFHAWG